MSKESPKYNEIVFTDIQEKEIIDMYLNQNLSTVKIGKHFNVSHKIIAKVLDRHGIPRTGVGRRKYELNQNYFDVIDTPNKAYILGFFYADGNNCKEKANIRMALQEDDGYILEKIRKELMSKKPLTYIDNSQKNAFGKFNMKNQWQLDMYSAHMCKVLESIGMTPNKSLTLTLPDIPDNLLSHFLRGYMDGDGTISKSGYCCSFLSTKDFCNQVNNKLDKILGITGKLSEASNHNGITFVLNFTNKNACKKFLDFIYKDSEIYLLRKYERYINMFNYTYLD